jgi:hypothetical protein
MNTIDGQHPLDPILPAAVSTDAIDDMAKRKKATVTIQVFYHSADGTDYNEIQSEPLPTDDYPIEKAIAHLGARAAEAIAKRTGRKDTHLRD